MNRQQIEILSLIVQGKTNREISDKLGILYWKLAKICSAIYWELQVDGRLDVKVRYEERRLPPELMFILDKLVKPKVILRKSTVLSRGVGQGSS